MMKNAFWVVAIGSIVCLTVTVQSEAGVQYSNDFENPSSNLPWVAWPEWVDCGGGTARAVNGRIEWYGDGGNNQWIRLNRELPSTYVMEFDFFHPENVNARFSVWPMVKEGEGIFERHNYFLRKNTHYFNGADTIPSEGPRDMTLPVGSKPHRLRFEVKGDHVVFLYKDRGEGGWILVDERDFPAFGDGARYVQLGNNHDSGTAGVHWIDNFVLSYTSQDLFSYSNNFDNPSSNLPWTAWPEWIDFGGGTARAVNGRIEWYGDGGNNQWIRLDKQLPMNYVMEFDFFHPADVNSRFSVWPLVGVNQSIFDRHNYFLRKNTHYFNGADTIPSEGPRDLTLPVGSPPHRLRFEVTGDHVVFLYKDRGQGGWILVDERDFPPFGDGPRYVQLGNNHDSGTSGVHYIDNFEIRGLADNRAVVDRSIGATNFVANTPVPISLKVSVTGNIPSMTIVEGIPERWSIANISHGGVVSDGHIIWSFTNQNESMTLTYNAIPPRLVLNRVAGFSGSVDSGDGEERITGDTAITILLPYLYREGIDYDFSGSPVNGKKYPVEHELDVLYAAGMDGIPSDVAYTRPTADNAVPAIDQVFDFPASADFHQGNPDYNRGEVGYHFEEYRDTGEVQPQHSSSDTGQSLGSLDPGDWFRYTFDLGEGDQVLMVNASLNTWGSGGDGYCDVYVDNKYKGTMQAPLTSFNAFTFFSVGPFEVSGGEHSIVFAFPSGLTSPTDLGRFELVRVKGIGRVERQLTADGFFNPSQPLTVTLKAEALYGTYTAFVDEILPAGVTVTNPGQGGVIEGNHLFITFDPTATSKTVTYTLQPAEGSRFLLFDGLCDSGLPLADPVRGDVSVTNQIWLFGNVTKEVKDDFNGTALAAPWVVEYGSDPALKTNYQDGVTLAVENGKLTLGVDTISMPDKFSEWSNGRRAPLVLRTDIPAGDWRMETSLKLVDSLGWSYYTHGLFVAYNDGNDTDVSGDVYLFGFSESEIWCGLTNRDDVQGSLAYHEFTDEADWIDMLLAGEIEAKIAVTRRSNELIFSAQLPGKSWQLVGAPLTERRTPTRIGIIVENWGSDNYSTSEFDYFTLSTLEVFTDISDWALY